MLKKCLYRTGRKLLQMRFAAICALSLGSRGVGKMRLVRLSSSSAIKVRINVKHWIRDRVTFKISVRAKVWACLLYTSDAADE